MASAGPASRAPVVEVVPMVRSALLALLTGLVFLSGCASTGLSDAARPSSGQGLVLSASTGLEPARHGEAFAALVVVACFAIAFVVIADLCILPFSYRRRHLRFPCSRWVWRSCCR